VRMVMMAMDQRSHYLRTYRIAVRFVKQNPVATAEILALVWLALRFHD